MIAAAGNALTRVFDLILFPARNAAPVWGISIAALLTAAFVLLTYRLVSDQGAIRRAKKRVQGHLLGIYLYRDEPAVMMGCLARVWGSSLAYMGRSLTPLAVAIVPVTLICVQLDLRYAHRPLRKGETAIVSVDAAARPALAASAGLRIETPSVAIGGGETDWRVGAAGEGDRSVTASAAGESVVMPVAVGGPLRPLVRARERESLWGLLRCPAAEPIPAGSPLRAVRVDYHPERVRVMGMRLHWSIAYFALALVFGLLLKRPFGVEF